MLFLLTGWLSALWKGAFNLG